MTALDATQARTRLHSPIDEASRTHRPIMITGENGNAVLVVGYSSKRHPLMKRSMANPWRESE